MWPVSCHDPASLHRKPHRLQPFSFKNGWGASERFPNPQTVFVLSIWVETDGLFSQSMFLARYTGRDRKLLVRLRSTQCWYVLAVIVLLSGSYATSIELLFSQGWVVMSRSTVRVFHYLIYCSLQISSHMSYRSSSFISHEYMFKCVRLFRGVNCEWKFRNPAEGNIAIWHFTQTTSCALSISIFNEALNHSKHLICNTLRPLLSSPIQLSPLQTSVRCFLFLDSTQPWSAGLHPTPLHPSAETCSLSAQETDKVTPQTDGRGDLFIFSLTHIVLGCAASDVGDSTSYSHSSVSTGGWRRLRRGHEVGRRGMRRSRAELMMWGIKTGGLLEATCATWSELDENAGWRMPQKCLIIWRRHNKTVSCLGFGFAQIVGNHLPGNIAKKVTILFSFQHAWPQKWRECGMKKA